jgi:hypothetical protein
VDARSTAGIPLLLLCCIGVACGSPKHPSGPDGGVETSPPHGSPISFDQGQVISLALGLWQAPEIVLSTSGNVCADLQANVVRQNSSVLQLTLLSSAPPLSGGAVPLLTGSYAIDPEENLFCLGAGDCDFQASAVLLSFGTGCNLTQSEVADSGAVTVTTSAQGRVAGSYAIQLASGTQTGTFDTGWCQLPGSLPASTCP